MPNLFGKTAVLTSGDWSWCCNGLAEDSIIRAAATLMIAALTIACYARWVKKSNKNLPPLPPGPPGLPILGNLPFLQPDLHQYFFKLSQIYGPIIKLQLGSKICIVINSASVAKEVLKDHDAIFANRDPPMAAIIGTYGGSDIAWRPNSPEWRKLRRLLVREMMSNTCLDGCYALRRREVREMVKDIYGKVGSSSPVNIVDQMFLTSLNVITSMLWRGSLHGEERNRVGIEFRQAIVELVELLGAPNVSDLFPFLSCFDLQGIQSRMKKASTWFDEILESIIAKQTKVDQAEGGEGKDFLQLLLELNQQGDYKSTLSMNEIKALLMDIIVAGTDTTSTTLEWAMTELLQHPDKMRRALEELDVVVGDRDTVEEYHFPKLVYLDAVIKETLRLHPPTPLLLPRRPSMSCVLAGYTIPKDSRVLCNVWAIQRDPEFWEDTLQFEPERHLKDNEKGNYLGNNFHFLPFGSGRRICAGIALAERMLRHVLATLLHSFEWKLAEGTKLEMQENFGIVLKKKEPLVALPAARLPNLEQQYQ